MSPLFYARDRLGSIRNLVDTNGTVQADYAYDPWGNVTNKTGTAQASFGFAGMFVDHGTGLNLTLHRAYNPAQYRWLSRDPLGESADTNLYRYVFDNPLNLADPLGLQGGFDNFVSDVSGRTPQQLDKLGRWMAAYSNNPAWQASGMDPANPCGWGCYQMNQYITFWINVPWMLPLPTGGAAAALTKQGLSCAVRYSEPSLRGMAMGLSLFHSLPADKAIVLKPTMQIAKDLGRTYMSLKEGHINRFIRNDRKSIPRKPPKRP